MKKQIVCILVFCLWEISLTGLSPSLAYLPR